MVGRVVLGLGGHVVGEVVRQAPDDGGDGGSVPGREAADGKKLEGERGRWLRLEPPPN